MMNDIPAGHRRNAQGYLVPEALIAPIDLERDALVADVISRARALQGTMRDFKQWAFENIHAFVELSAEKYDAKLGGRKGNLSLVSYDGRFKVLVQVQDRLVFDERLTAAQALVDECVREWTEGSRAEVQALIEHAFQTDSEGRISTGRILTLTRLAIDDPKWKRAMEAVRDSMQVAATATYLRVYQRIGDTDRFEQIPLDLAAL